MTPKQSRDPDAITRAEACTILNASQKQLERLIRDGYLTRASRSSRRLSRREVESLATQRSEWLNARQVADILGVNKSRVGQLADKGFLPYEREPNGRRRYLRSQIEVIANARRARWSSSSGAASAGDPPPMGNP